MEPGLSVNLGVYFMPYTFWESREAELPRVSGPRTAGLQTLQEPLKEYEQHLDGAVHADE